MRADLAERVEGLGERRVAPVGGRPLPRAELEHHGRRSRASRARSTPSALIERFEAEHERQYGTRLEAGSPVAIRALRLTVVGPPRGGLASAPVAPTASAAGGVTRGRGLRRRARPPRGARRSRVPRSGSEPVQGPLLIDEYDTTVVVPPGLDGALAGRTTRSCSSTSRSRPARRGSGQRASRTRSCSRSSRMRSPRSPTRWRRRSSARPTPRWSATRWTSPPRCAARAATRSPRPSRSRSSSARSRTR